MIQMKLKSGQTAQIQYNDYDVLGEGMFGKSYRVTVQGEEYALKVIEVESAWRSPEKRRQQLRTAFREARLLNKAKELVGLEQDGNQVFVLMNLKQGDALEVDGMTNQSRKDTIFHAIRNLQRKGVVHGDPNPANYLLQAATRAPEQVNLVDFGLSQDYSVLRGLYDAYKFSSTFDQYKFINDNHQRMNSLAAPMGGGVDFQMFQLGMIATTQNWSISKQAKEAYELARLYAVEMHQYIKENKAKFARDLLFYGALTITAVYGVSQFAAVSLVATQLMKLVGLNAASEWFLNCAQTADQRNILFGDTHESFGKQFKADAIAYRVLSASFVALGFAVSLTQADLVLLALIPLWQTYELACDTAERYLFSEDQLRETCMKSVYRTGPLQQLRAVGDFAYAVGESAVNAGLEAASNCKQKLGFA